jgi:hypothetical protein
MRWPAVILIGTFLAFVGCGSDGGGVGDGGATQSELAEIFIAIAPAEIPEGIDEDCIRDKTAELSDEDAQFVIDNFDVSDVQVSDELQAWADSIDTCILEGSASETPEPDAATDDTGGASGSVQADLAARLVEQSSVAGLGIDEECAQENAAGLSDDDAQFLLDNFYTTLDLETTPEQQVWVDSIVDCLR